MSNAGVAESIRVIHTRVEQYKVHTFTVKWTDPGARVHGRRFACVDEYLHRMNRSVYLISEWVPGVGLVCVGYQDGAANAHLARYQHGANGRHPLARTSRQDWGVRTFDLPVEKQVLAAGEEPPDWVNWCQDRQLPTQAVAMSQPIPLARERI